MHHSASHRGRQSALAPAAALLLALCLLAVGAQALTDPAATAALVVSGPGLYELDHDLAPSDPIGVLINGSDVVFDGMGHRIAGTGATGSVGVLVTGRFTAAEGEMSTNVTVRNVTVSGWDDGIHVAETSNSVVEGVVAEQNSVGLDISASTGTTDHHVVRDSVFRENTGDVLRGKGILVMYPAQGITVERCSITENSGGIYADLVHSGSTPNLLADCDISGNAGDGLSSHEGSFAIVRNCTVRDNGDDGLEFEHGGAEIVGNRIDGNAGRGVHASGRGGCDIHGNWIEGNAVGVSAGGDWPSHVRNNVLNNTDNGYFGYPLDSGYLNYTKSARPNIIGGPYLGGNVWAHPNGIGFSQTHPDTDGDGFCDEPYHVSEDAVDYLPLALPKEEPPVVGGDTGYFLVSTTPAGAAIYLEDISGTRYLMGNTTNGPVNASIHLTATPMRKIIANLSGYRDAAYTITQYPAKGQTVPVDLVLEAIPTVTPSPPFWTPYKPLSVPGRIQAEDYNLRGEGIAYHDTTPGNTGGAYRQDDVDIETAGGITNVGWIRDGEYLTYTVNVTEAGNYAVSARVASPDSGRRISFSVDGQPQTVLTLPTTGSFDTYVTATRIYYTGSPHYPLGPTLTPTPSATGFPPSEHPLRLTAGTHTLKLVFSGDGQNLDWFELSPYVEPTPVVPTPYKPLSIPGTIQAEDYNLGGEGVAYHDTTAGNSGGAYRHDDVDIETAGGITNVGWVRNGEYLTYTANVAQPGDYTLTARVASPNTGRAAYLIVDGVQAATILVPNTGSFTAYRDVSPHMYVGNPLQTPTPAVTPVEVAVPIALTAGTHTLKLAFSGDGLNIDWIAFAPVAAPTPTPMPYRNVTLPGTIQAEDFDLGGEGVAYHDTAAGNSGNAYRQEDVDIAGLSAGGYAVVGIEDGEWLAFTVNGSSAPVGYLPPLGLYAASDRDGRSVELEVDGKVLGNVSIPNTGNLSAPVWVQTQCFITGGGRPLAGPHMVRLLFHGSGQSLDRIESPLFASLADAYAWANFTAAPTNGTAPLVVRFTDTSSEWANGWAWDFGDGQTSTEQNPVHTFQRSGVYNVSLNVRETDRWLGGSYLHIWNDLSHGKTVQVTVEGTGPAVQSVPGTIQAEDYDAGGEGIAYHDTTPGNSGGAYRQDDVDIEAAGGVTNVGWIRNGESLTYTTAVQATGMYTMAARVASPNSGRAAVLSVDGVQAATIAVPNTGSFSTFRTVFVPVPVALPAGVHTLKLTFQGDGQNIDWIEIPARNVTTPTPTPTPEAGGASFTAAPLTAPKGTAVKFTVTPASGKTVRAAWWSFDVTAHLNAWNSRATNPTFFYPAAGTFSPLVKLTYTDGSTETVQRTGYIRAT